MMSKEAMNLAKAWFERNTYGDEAVDVYDALCEALAKQPAQQALDKMAENARELGLDYEPAQQKESMRPYRLLQDNGSKYFGDSWDKAEQPAQQEPVNEGWKLVPVEPTEDMWKVVNKLDDEMAAGSYDGKGCSIEQAWNCLLDAAPTPPAQRTWVGLTNNELQPIADEYRILFGSWVEDFARAIEAKLKEKNNG